jgi:hypothetical protein
VRAPVFDERAGLGQRAKTQCCFRQSSRKVPFGALDEGVLHGFPMLAHIATILAFGTLLGSASTCREDKRPHPSGQILLGTQYLTLAEPRLHRAACLVLQFSHVEKSRYSLRSKIALLVRRGNSRALAEPPKQPTWPDGTLGYHSDKAFQLDRFARQSLVVLRCLVIGPDRDRTGPAARVR